MNPKFHKTLDNARLFVEKYAENSDYYLNRISNKEHYPELYDGTKKEARLLELSTIRYLIEQLVSSDVTVHYNSHGAPVLSNGMNVCISHTSGYAMIYYGEVPLGADMEIIGLRVLKIVEKFVSDIDCKILNKHSEFDMTLCWCVKEAVYKLYQKGNIEFKDEIHLMSHEKIEKSVIVDFRGKMINMEYKIVDKLLIVYTVN